MTNYRGTAWTEAEITIVRDNPELFPKDLVKFLPGRTHNAIAQVRFRLDGRKAAIKPEYAVKVPGKYVECLSHYLVQDFECMEIWARWNGYATWEVLEMDERGWVRVRCTAKG